ncbi:MAG: DNA polymerase III subunit delta [Spirochaetes bacterium]|nr:MAG: DNA polymerase III subunit delta [Spirochaetota bacterium]
MSKIASVYLFTGPENGEKEKAIGQILNQYKTTTGNDPETYRFYPFETSVGEVVSLLKNGDLFSDYKFVFIHNADEIKKNEIPYLVSYVKEPGDSATLFLLTDSYKVDPKLSAAVGKASTRIFWELFENQKVNWIRGYFKKESLSISPEAVEMILDLVENRTDDLKVVCERLAVFFKDRGHISEEIIEEYVFHSKEENVFTLFDKMVRNDFAGSIEILHKLALSGSNNPVQLLSGLYWQYRNLLKLKHLLSEGENEQKAMAALKIRGKKKQALYLAAQDEHSLGELESTIMLIADYDKHAREVSKERWMLVMEMFIHQAVNRRED